ncbi:hypothetical protein [uncultured Amphritea sp.]|uniref:hypothetical protein n=1 Tax=uncultured Amphritea sp. TaxID=981605 RepID=UPI002627B558|nr:hypothetical protein [uncultured Amphritea sp.]
MKNASAVQIPDLSGSNEYPTDRDIVAALAGELMSACVRVSMTSRPDIFIDYSAHVDSICCRFFYDGWVSGYSGKSINVSLKGAGAAGKIRALIMQVEALGEVSA